MATRTISIAGGNFNTTAAWDEAAVPVAGDTIVARGDGLSGNITVTATAPATGTLGLVNFTNYSGLWTVNSAIQFAFTGLTLSATMTIAGTGTWLGATGNYTSNGKVFNGNLRFSTVTATLVDNWSVSVDFSPASGAATVTLNGNTLYITAGTLNAIGGIIQGTTNIEMQGTSTISGGAIKNNLTINSVGTVTINAFFYDTGTFTYTAGTITNTAITTIRASCTLTGWNGTATQRLQSITFSTAIKTITLGSDLILKAALLFSGNFATTFAGAFNITCATLTFSQAATNTLSGNITCTGTMTVNTGAVVVNGAFTIYAGGALTLTAQPISGTATIELNGTGTWAGSTTAASVANNLNVNTAGTITMSTAYYKTGTISLITGTVTGTLNIQGSCTIFTTAAKNWAAVTVGATATVTMSNALSMTGLLTLSAASTFSGAYNITCVGMTCSAAVTHTLSGNIDCNGTLTVNTGTVVINGAFSISVSGSLTLTNAGSSGAATIVMDGTGTWTASTTTAVLKNNLTVNTAGTFTISGTVYYNVGTLTYTAGTITSAGSTIDRRGSTITLSGWGSGGSTTSFNNLTYGTNISQPMNVTMLTDITINGTMFVAGSHVIGGSFVLTCGSVDVLTTSNCNFSEAASSTPELVVVGAMTVSGAGTVTLEWYNVGITCDTLVVNSSSTLTVYGIINVTTNLYVNGTVAAPVVFQEEGVGFPFYLNYLGTQANCKVFCCTGTKVDASGSAVIVYDWYGTATSCTRFVAVTGADIGGGGGGGAGVQVVMF